MEEQLSKLLQSVYPGEEIPLLIEEIKNTIESHQSEVHAPRLKLSEKDILLITYADQIEKKGQSKLQTLHGFLDKFLKDSINTVHLLPFYPYSSDDGFSVIDYYQVDRGVGDWQDITRLAADYHLMFDGVINHISQESEWVKEYLEDNPAYTDFFTEVDPTDDLSAVTRPRTSPVYHAYASKRGEKRFLWTTFSEDQVDLNYRNPRVFLKVLDVLLFYISKGAQLIRLDAIGFLWKKIGTPCIHLKETHALIQAMRLVLKELNEGIILITETNVPHKENISYFGNGHNEAKMVYNFTLPPMLAFSLLSGETQKITSWAQSLKLPSDDVCFFNFTASHDGVGLRPVQGILTSNEIKVLTEAVERNGGFISYKANEDGTKSPYELNCNYLALLNGPDDDLGWRRFIASQAVMLTMPGLPAIYIHSLLGSDNDLEGVRVSGRYRSINREKLSMDQLESELSDEKNERFVTLNKLKALIGIRKNEPSFHPLGEFSFPDYGPGTFAIMRSAKHQQRKVLAIYNFTAQNLTISNLPESSLDLLSDESLSDFPPFGFKWLLLK